MRCTAVIQFMLKVDIYVPYKCHISLHYAPERNGGVTPRREEEEHRSDEDRGRGIKEDDSRICAAGREGDETMYIVLIIINLILIFNLSAQLESLHKINAFANIPKTSALLLWYDTMVPS